MQSIIVTTIYLLSILIPLTFTTINYELFEFPKFILLLSGALIISAAWIIHLYHTRDFKIKLTPLHYSVLAILITQALATLFSIHPYTSFWGYYSRFHQGLLTTICYTIIYFAAVKWMDTKSTQKLIKISVSTAFIISLFAIAEHFGIDKTFWIQDVQSRVFATIGQPNWLAAYLIPNLFLTLYLSHTNKNSPSHILHSLLFIILFIALLFTKSRSGLIGFALSFVVYWALILRQFPYSKVRASLIRYFLFIIIAISVIGTPFTPKLIDLIQKPLVKLPPIAGGGTVLENGGTESGDIRKIVWTGALKLIAKHPILGTGPETFAYTYYWERPLAHNQTSEWDFLYNKAHNEYLNIAAGAGIIGLLAYLYFHYAVFAASLTRIPKSKKVSQDKEDYLRHLYPVLGASVVGFALTNFFGFSVIPVYFMMILLSTLCTSSAIAPEKLGGPLLIHYVFLLLVLIYPLRLFLADTNYAGGKAYLDAGQLAPALSLLQKAVRYRPGLDLYHATLGEAYAISGQKDRALQEVQINQKLNPYHLNFYKSRAKIYLTLNMNDQAAAELSRARSLAPTDPKLAYNLGLTYTRLDKVDLAETQLNNAISLKPNYAEPYYALTLLFEQTKQTLKIPPLLSGAKSHLATYSAQLKEKIDKYAP